MKNTITFSLALIITSAVTFGQNLANSKNNKSKELQSFFQYAYDNDLFNGSVLVVENNEIIFKESYGYRHFDRQKQIDADSKFLLASLSKQFTAMGIVILKSQEKLDYEDKIVKYIPDFPYQEITVRQLLNHTSGIPEYQQFFNKQREQLAERYKATGKVIVNQDVLNLIIKNKPPLDFTPGTNFNYSNSGYVLLAHLIERLSNQSYSSFMNTMIFQPLNMKNSFVFQKENITIAKESNIARGYKYNNEHEKLALNETPEFFNVVGDGGIYSTINDLIKWDSALRNEDLVSNEELKEMYTTPLLKNNPSPYGFGWFVRRLPFNGNKAVTHSGIFVGFTNSIFRDLTDDNTAIVLSNNSHKINGEINSAVVRILYGLPYELPKIKVASMLYKLINDQGITAAEKFYQENKESNKYDFSERELNGLGYDLLRNANVKDAIEIFKWNVSANPKSGNVYDSLGEAYLEFGNKLKALENYKKAFAIDPNNKNAQQIVKKLESN